MIKLKSLLTERILDLNKKEDAAEHLIKLTWKFIPPSEDRYNSENIILWIDNEQPLSDLAWKLSKQFYPGDDEAWYTFQDDLKNVLIKMEESRLKRKRSKNPSIADPVYILKKLMVGKNWEQVKIAISNQLPGRIKHKPTDEEASEVFNRLYKNAMGETIYNKEELVNWGYGRLDQAIINPDTDGNHKQYAINVFLRHYSKNGKINGMVRVWRGTNSPHAKIRPGDFVTFDRGYAQAYLSGKWASIVTDTVNAKDLIIYKIDPGMSELVYWPEGHQIQKYEGPIPTLREFWEQYRFGI